MPRDFDPLPQEKPKGKKLIAHELLKSQEPSRATFPEYEEMVADRPEKFTAEEVNYRKATDPGSECEHCVHFFQQVAGERRRTCEIFRPAGKDESVNPEWVCDFMTRDGKTYPYQKSSSPSPSGEEEKGGKNHVQQRSEEPA